jgi:DNA-binding beta-propeller fold protein YncE
VANASDGSISIVDPISASVVQELDDVCGFPIAFSAENHSQVWLACFASGELVAIDPRKFVVMQRIRLSQPPLNVVTHPNRRLAYVSFPRQNAIAEIDLESGAELRRLRVGIEPDGLRWAHTDHAD